MMRKALLISAALIVSACFAEAKAQCGFGTNVPMLPANFVPNLSGDPDPTGLPQAPDDIKNALQAAYANAPPSFQTLLCDRLNGVFITQGPTSWGYRRVSAMRPYQRYLALTINLWTSTTPGRYVPISFEAYQNRVFLDKPLSLPAVSAPFYGPAVPVDGTRAILASLAHEYGHIYWNDVLIDPPASNPMSSRFCNSLLSIAWTGGPLPIRWTKFGDRDSNDATIDDTNDPPQLGEPTAAAAKVRVLVANINNKPLARLIVWRLLSPVRPFPSVLGAFSANEQFVETFELYVLTHPQGKFPLTSLPLHIFPSLPGKVRDVPQDLRTSTPMSGRAALKTAIGCLDRQPVPPP